LSGIGLRIARSSDQIQKIIAPISAIAFDFDQPPQMLMGPGLTANTRSAPVHHSG
jgi:hypothetical protein